MRLAIGLYLVFTLAGCHKVEVKPPPAKLVTIQPVIIPVMAAEDETGETERAEQSARVEIRPLSGSRELEPTQPIEAVETRKIIYINLAHDNQRGQSFVAFEDGQDVLAGLVSGAVSDIDYPPNQHSKEPHNHIGQFQVGARKQHYYSRTHHCDMPFSLFYHNGFGHAIHACQPGDVDKLGQPASHGCIRVSPQDARSLFDWADDDPVTVVIARE